MDGGLNPLLGAPLEPPEDVWAAAVSGALDDARDPAELAALVPDVEDALDAAAPAGEPQADDDGPADPGPGTDDPGRWGDDVDHGQSAHQAEAPPDADDAGWAG